MKNGFDDSGIGIGSAMFSHAVLPVLFLVAYGLCDHAFSVSGSDDLSLERAENDFAGGNLERALAGYEAILEADPENRRARDMAALLRYRAGDLGEMIEHLSRGRERFGDTDLYCLLEGNLALQDFRPADAAKCYHRGLKLSSHREMIATLEANLEITREQLNRARMLRRYHSRSGAFCWAAAMLGVVFIVWVIRTEWMKTS